MIKVLNITQRKFICVDSKAQEIYQYVRVGSVYSEAFLDMDGRTNIMPSKFVLLLVHGFPFYVEKVFVCRFDEENDETRIALCQLKFCLN